MWFCGLPGSGKSTVARGVYDRVFNSLQRRDKKGHKISLVQMDSIRKLIFPDPTYSDQERDAAYRSFVLIAKFLSENGVAVLLDGTGHKLAWREFARQQCPNFVEAYLKCPAEIAIQRETSRVDGIRAKLYLDALDRLKTGKKIEGLGKVPGVDEPFEQSPSPEIVIDSSKRDPSSLVSEALQALCRLEGDIFCIENGN